MFSELNTKIAERKLRRISMDSQWFIHSILLLFGSSMDPPLAASEESGLRNGTLDTRIELLHLRESELPIYGVKDLS